MSDDNFDDGLVHNHGWAREPAVTASGAARVARAAEVPTPSTAFHDDRIEQLG